MYGNFIKDTAGYEITTLNLPASWEYIYENRDILLKVDQFGPVYAQAHPPGDIMLFKREQHQKFSPWSVGISSDRFPETFTNFFRPNNIGVSAEPENLKITYLPEGVTYAFDYNGISVSTEFIIPQKGTTIAMRFKAKNISGEKITLNIKPHLVPYLNEATMAPWDKYEWYLDSSCEKTDAMEFLSKLLSADALSDKRREVSFVSDSEGLEGYELSLEKYVGFGDIVNPERVYTNDTRIYGYPPVYACNYAWELGAGEEKQLVQVLSLDGIEDSKKYFENAYFDAQKMARKDEFEKLFSKNHINTGREDFDRYVNYWLPMQMSWVASLDRGWPTGMRGSRDSAQDYAALLYTDTKNPRYIIMTMMECQRSDGWFPRQYSARGKHGKHDLRTHVDGGAFFIEFVWKYLAHTGDYGILNERIEWLDSDTKSSALEHLLTAVEYYIADENIGKNGLCKIRGGDWLDAVNTAGLLGRGESVTVSCQTVMSMAYISDILKKLDKNADVEKYLDMAERLKDNINKYAFNKKGFYNGVFNDDGKWIFSDNDPDGEERVYGVSNYYAIISGVADNEKHKKIFDAVENLKCDKGYRLFWPYLGKKPIEKVGRIASGDVPRCFGENGNVYNHGSQGFFARALSVAGEGDRLYDVLRWIMPFDTEKHPTEIAFTPPYAIVNCWQELPEFNHRGLMCFLTGSVAMAMRGVYEWMIGIAPTLDGIEICPCLPGNMDRVLVKYTHLDIEYNILIENGKVFVDGREITEKRISKFTGKECFVM